jgi:5-methylcytosine-specific restriction endonuclease McrA
VSPDDTTPLKTCTKCGREFPATLEYFQKHKKNRLRPDCKTCAAIRKKQYYLEHRIAILAKDKAQYDADPEAERQRVRDYAATHRDQEKARASKWVAENKDHKAAYDREYRARNLDHITEHQKEWYANNGTKVRARNARRRALEMLADGSFTTSDIRLLYTTQKGLCWWCGNPLNNDYHIDHRLALTRGGTNNPNNLCLACPTCNRSKHNKLPWEWIGRLL